MLSSLPPELLLQIIESTVPHNFHTRTYYDRQQTLCSLSLVSKQLYAIAQPLLYEVVWIKSPETFESYKTTMGTAGEAARGVGKIRRLKTVVIGSGSWNGSVTMAEEAMSKEIPEWLSSVRSLTWDLNSAAVEGLPSLTSFSDLSNPRLSRISFPPGNLPKLSKLQCLTMYDVEGSAMALLLDPAVVPTLKHLSLVDITAKSVRHLKKSRLVDLLPQLETLNVGPPIRLCHKLSFLQSAAERTLVDCSYYELPKLADPELRVAHTRVCYLRMDSSTAPSTVYGWLVQYIHFFKTTPTLPLRSLYLDSSLQPTSNLPQEIREAMDNLIDICQERKIDLVFEPVPLDLCLDPCISREFIKRQKMSRKQLGKIGGSE